MKPRLITAIVTATATVTVTSARLKLRLTAPITAFFRHTLCHWPTIRAKAWGPTGECPSTKTPTCATQQHWETILHAHLKGQTVSSVTSETLINGAPHREPWSPNWRSSRNRDQPRALRQDEVMRRASRVALWCGVQVQVWRERCRAGEPADPHGEEEPALIMPLARFVPPIETPAEAADRVQAVSRCGLAAASSQAFAHRKQRDVEASRHWMDAAGSRITALRSPQCPWLRKPNHTHHRMTESPANLSRPPTRPGTASLKRAQCPGPKIRAARRRFVSSEGVGLTRTRPGLPHMGQGGWARRAHCRVPGRDCHSLLCPGRAR